MTGKETRTRKLSSGAGRASKDRLAGERTGYQSPMGPVRQSFLPVTFGLPLACHLWPQPARNRRRGRRNRNACRVLTELGCDELQGYLPSKPLRAEEFARYLHRAEKATDSGDLARPEDAR